MRGVNALQAYKKSSAHRTLREQEADVFYRVNTALRLGQDADVLARSRAVADNERLWIAIMDLVRDPANSLPVPIRASILSLGFAVRREIAGPAPDLGFLIAINEQIAAGLSATG